MSWQLHQQHTTGSNWLLLGVWSSFPSFIGTPSPHTDRSLEPNHKHRHILRLHSLLLWSCRRWPRWCWWCWCGKQGKGSSSIGGSPRLPGWHYGLVCWAGRVASTLPGQAPGTVRSPDVSARFVCERFGNGWLFHPRPLWIVIERLIVSLVFLIHLPNFKCNIEQNNI